MTTPTDNHQLELVGGEWESLGRNMKRRYYGPFVIFIGRRLQGLGYDWTLEAGHWRRSPDNDTSYPATEPEAIDAAEAALLEEIYKFVRVVEVTSKEGEK